MSQGRNLQWWQGALVELDGCVGVLISHDCDLAATAEVEPQFEFIPIREAAEDGGKTYGKNPRVLQLRCGDPSTERPIYELDIRRRACFDKDRLTGEATLHSVQFAPAQLVILRRWLSARYGRSAFPDSFESRMDPIRGRIDELSKKSGAGIRALYFDVDDGHMTERENGDEPYELIIYVVYPLSKPAEEAEQFAEKLKAIIEKQFCKEEIWRKVELTSCTAVCEDEFPLLLANSTKTWRVDHRSLAGSGDVLPNPDR